MLAPAFTLTSPQTGTAYPIYIVTDANDPGAAPLPAVVFLDGDDQFSHAVAAYRALRSEGALPPLLLAGVGYGATYKRPANKRLRDYTATALADEPGSGGADRFLAFLTDTLWPELARRYPLRPDHRGLAGHSLGALFALHALFRHRPFFHRILASAPSLGWDDRAALCTAQTLQRTGVALPARLHLSVGEADTDAMTTDLDQLEDQLAALPFPELEVVGTRFPGRNHFDVIPHAFRAGLRALYG